MLSVGPYCPPNYYCGAAPTTPPTTFSAVATPVKGSGAQSGGTVTFAVQADCGGGNNGCPSGYSGAIGVVLVDQAVCSPTTNCTSATFMVDVYMAGG